MNGPAAAAGSSSLAPLRHRAFALLWSAALLANVGTWFRDVANGWTMTELSPSPLLVALVQAAAMLPVFLLSLPAGALADLVDRRRLLIGIQLWLALVSLGLATAQSLGLMTPALLLALAAAGGVGAALMGPPWQAIVPELVPRAELRAAVALNSLGINIARAIGPALGGAIVATAGAAVAYWIDVVSYLPVILALLLWRRTTPSAARPPERLGPAMLTGVRFVAHSADVRRALLRAGTFFVFASAYWALLPLVARVSLRGDAATYGVLLTAVGAGAVGGALLLPAVSRRVGGDVLVFGATCATAVAMTALALAPGLAAAAAALLVAGAAWIAALTTLNVAAQTVLPNWVRARGLAVYITVFFGAMTLGAFLWGGVAQRTGVPTALLVAALGAALAGLAVRRVPLPAGVPDLTPSLHWPEPATATPVPGERGPVMITIEYRVADADRRAFLDALYAFAPERQRDGGYGWQVHADAADPERYTEVFFAASWVDHLRSHERVTKADAERQRALLRFHRGPAPPRVTHWLAARPDDADTAAPLPPHGADVE